MTPLPIDRIVFLIHPMTWRGVSGNRTRDIPYDDYLDCEEIVAARWRAGIEEMADKQNEALALISPSPPDDLSDLAIRSLESRAFILREYVKDGEPDEFTHPDSCTELVPRLRHMASGYGLEFAPDVTAVTWGESFAGCAANYSRFLVTMLGMSTPSELVFRMTVPDELFLHPMVVDAPYEAPVPVAKSPTDRPVLLYAWDAEEDWRIAWFHTTMATVGDSPLWARIKIPDCEFEVRHYSGRIWPADESICREEDGRLVLPIWGEPVGTPVWGTNFVFARGIGADEFRAAMAGAEIEEG